MMAADVFLACRSPGGTGNKDQCSTETWLVLSHGFLTGTGRLSWSSEQTEQLNEAQSGALNSENMSPGRKLSSPTAQSSKEETEDQ